MDRSTFQQLDPLSQLMRTINLQYQLAEHCGNASYAELVELYSGMPLPEFGGIANSDLKSIEAATEWRTKGNAAYTKDKNYPRALECYTKSVCAAPYPMSGAHDSTELALAFADRSEVLYTMNMYDECLKDVERALKYDYPKKLKYKLYIRRGDCLQIMGKMEEAKESFEEAAHAVPLAVDLAVAGKKKELVYIRLQLDRIKKGYPRDEVYQPKPQRLLPQVADGVNSQVPAASSCVEVADKPEWGRHIRATRDIKPGEVIIIEDPYVATLNVDTFLLFCHNCLEKCDSLVPCKTCQIVGFCSEKCRDIGMKSVHDIECPILVQLVKQVQGQYIWTALRILIIACKRYTGLRGLYKQVQEIEKNSLVGKIKGFNNDSQYLSSDYTTVHFLTTNKEKHIQRAILEYAPSALTVVNCLRKHGIYQKDINDPVLKLFVKGFLLHIQMCCQVNCYPMYEVDIEVNKLQMMKCEIGCVLDPTISLINHSCMANAYMMPHGTKIVVKSVLPIAKGEQVFLDYIAKSRMLSLGERCFVLSSNDYFVCKCILCTLQLPDQQLEHPLLYWECLKCSTKLPTVGAYHSKIPCRQCKKMNPFHQVREEAVMRLNTYKKVAKMAMFGGRNMTDELAAMLTEMFEKNVKPELLFFYKNLLKYNDALFSNYTK